MTFKIDLLRGQKGEQAIIDLYPSLKFSQTRDYDLVTESGLRLEVKTDSTKYSNIYLETISNDTKRSPGGIFQSMFHGADYYVYRFERSNTIYCYRVTDLV